MQWGLSPPTLLWPPVFIHLLLPLFKGALGRKHMVGSTLSSVENIWLGRGGVRAQVLLLQAAFPDCPAHSTHPSLSLTTLWVTHVSTKAPGFLSTDTPFLPFLPQGSAQGRVVVETQWCPPDTGGGCLSRILGPCQMSGSAWTRARE